MNHGKSLKRNFFVGPESQMRIIEIFLRISSRLFDSSKSARMVGSVSAISRSKALSIFSKSFR